jgi:predicted DNA-binding transcriptional regulator AlpA
MKTRVDRTLPDALASERVLSARQGAELLGVSLATFRRLHWAGKLPTAIQLSDRRLGWRVKDLLAHLAKRGEVAA